jgi:DNA replication licensing factor MCM6
MSSQPRHAPSSIAPDMTDNEDAGRRGDDEAEEGTGAPRRKGARKNRVRINRDQGDVPPVRDDTGEKVTELFQQFLEQ